MKNKIAIHPNKGIFINNIPILLQEHKDKLFSIIPKAEIKFLGINNEWSIIYQNINFTVAFDKDSYCNYISYIPFDREDMIFLGDKTISSNVEQTLKVLNFYKGKIAINEYNEKYIVHFGLNPPENYGKTKPIL